MRRGFFNGLITGSILVAIYGLFARPEMKPTAKRFVGQSKNMQKKATRIFKDVSKSMNDIFKK